jgi:hypothetical protein
MKRIIPFLPWLIALLLIAFALLRFEDDLLWRVQQNDLFLNTSLFFHDKMLVPGGFLSYLSCYFTQFFCHPWIGVLILCACWLLLMWLIKRTFRIADNWAILALIPVATLLVANMSLGYWHYLMRVRGYFFIPTIGATIAVAMLWAFRSLPQKVWIRSAWILLVTAIGYPLFGIYALAAVVLMAIWTWRLSDKKQQNIILSVVALLCIIAIPIICYRYIYYQTYFKDLWTTGLPIVNVLKQYHSFYVPYYILALFFLVMVVATPQRRGEESKKHPKIQKKQSLIMWGLQGALAVALIAFVYHYWYKDEDFHHELAMHRCIEKADWEGVINEGKKQKTEPTRSIVMMHNLALSRLGRQCDEMYNFPWGRKKGDPKVPYDMLNLVFSRTIFYQYGLLNDCHRRCLEDGVEYGWSVETLKYLARSSLLSHERLATQKILDILRHTMYHGEWADSIQVLLNTPKQIAQDREMGPVANMLHYKNALGLDEGNIEKYVMTVLASQDSRNPYFQEQAVLAALWKRNPRLFWGRFNRYAKLFPQGPIPRIFQEAAILFGHIENLPNIDNMPFDQSVKDSYEAFMKEGIKYDGQKAIVGRTALAPLFKNTYYFYYYFLQDMQ